MPLLLGMGLWRQDWHCSITIHELHVGFVHVHGRVYAGIVVGGLGLAAAHWLLEDYGLAVGCVEAGFALGAEALF